MVASFTSRDFYSSKLCFTVLSLVRTWLTRGMNKSNLGLERTRARLPRPDELCYVTWEELAGLACYFTENILLD